MKTSEIKSRMEALGKWNSHNIKLMSDEGEEIWTRPEESNGNKKLMRDTVQLIQDVFGDIKELSFLDLGAMEGLHGLNIKCMGSKKVYINEGKEENYNKIVFAREALKLYGCPVSNTDAAKMQGNNEIDIILCFGLIYLFDVPEVFEVIKNMYNMCIKGVIIDAVFEEVKAPIMDLGVVETEFKTDFEHIEYDGEIYYGNWRNNDPSAYNSSLEHNKSWHFTSESLRRYLDKVGFTTVYDRKYPDNPENKRTFLCIKGEKLGKLPMEK